MSRLCLDTSAYSHFKRGDPAVTPVIASARWIGVPTIVLGELRTGFTLGSRPDENEGELLEFLDHPIVHILDVDDRASHHYAEIVASLRRAGTPLPTNDLWIACLAAREGATVLTFDAHFERIARVATRVLEPAR